jgi:ADP-dependent phosphofructokinase/glucokinase
MDIATDTAQFTTTVQIPRWLRQEIKNAGFTVRGALISGWDAIKERKEGNRELAEMQANMEKYRAAYLRLKDRVEQLEKLP